MTPHRSGAVRSILAAALVSPLAAFATNGYFSDGYGMKNQGMGGAAVTQIDDAFGGANNPATSVWEGDRLDIGASVFSPRRDASRSGSPGGALDFSQASGQNDFLIPELGYNHQLRDDLAAGVTVYGNGGMNTNYPSGVLTCRNPQTGAPYSANALCGTGNLGVDLVQLMVAPTLSWRFNASNSIGISPILAYQRFQAQGLQLFESLSSAPSAVTNNGYDNSTGWGARIGYYGQWTDRLSFGASYASKIEMGKLSKYQGLFAEQGGFDIPSHFAFGFGLKARPDLKFAFDFERIRYSDVASVSDGSSQPYPLGTAVGPGFGWGDVSVYKLGAEWQYSPSLALRAGWNHGDDPVHPADVTFNIVAPGVVEDHLTLGFTWTLPSRSELTMAYMHAFTQSVTGPSYFNQAFRTTTITETIRMHEDTLGVAWGMRF